VPKRDPACPGGILLTFDIGKGERLTEKETSSGPRSLITCKKEGPDEPAWKEAAVGARRIAKNKKKEKKDSRTRCPEKKGTMARDNSDCWTKEKPLLLSTRGEKEKRRKRDGLQKDRTPRRRVLDKG